MEFDETDEAPPEKREKESEIEIQGSILIPLPFPSLSLPDIGPALTVCVLLFLVCLLSSDLSLSPLSFSLCLTFSFHYVPPCLSALTFAIVGIPPRVV